MKISKEDKFELFKNKVIEAVSSYYGEDCDVSIKPIQKLNGVILHGLNIMQSGSYICPTIYIENFYDRYEKGVAFSVLFREMIDIYEKHKDTEFGSLDFFTDYEKIRKHLSVKLVNAEYNRELLEDVPHIMMEDLAVVCIVEVMNSEINIGSVLIHNNHICMWGIKASKLLEDAMSNAQSINPAHIRKLSDIILDMYAKEGEPFRTNIKPVQSPDEMSSHELDMCRAEPANMFVLSNSRQMFGAATILYPGVLDSIGRALGNDFYILPSSIHEGATRFAV